MRIWKSHPLLNLVNSYLVDSPQPSNLSYAWNFGFLLAMCLITLIITGVTLAMHYNPSVLEAFNSVEHIMRDVNNGWLIRYLHSNTVSAFCLLVFLYIGKGLLSITAFLGYALPYGQMSLWGTTVITNLMSTLPWVGLLVSTAVSVLIKYRNNSVNIWNYILPLYSMQTTRCFTSPYVMEFALLHNIPYIVFVYYLFLAFLTVFLVKRFNNISFTNRDAIKTLVFTLFHFTIFAHLIEYVIIIVHIYNLDGLSGILWFHGLSHTLVLNAAGGDCDHFDPEAGLSRRQLAEGERVLANLDARLAQDDAEWFRMNGWMTDSDWDRIHRETIERLDRMEAEAKAEAEKEAGYEADVESESEN